MERRREYRENPETPLYIAGEEVIIPKGIERNHKRTKKWKISTTER